VRSAIGIIWLAVTGHVETSLYYTGTVVGAQVALSAKRPALSHHTTEPLPAVGLCRASVPAGASSRVGALVGRVVDGVATLNVLRPRRGAVLREETATRVAGCICRRAAADQTGITNHLTRGNLEGRSIHRPTSARIETGIVRGAAGGQRGEQESQEPTAHDPFVQIARAEVQEASSDITAAHMVSTHLAFLSFSYAARAATLIARCLPPALQPQQPSVTRTQSASLRQVIAVASAFGLRFAG
jgi:hypothetical protein